MTKDGIRKGAKVVRRKPLAGTYLRPEDKPDVAPPAPVVMTVLELRGRRVRVQVPPCDTWPEGHETWFGRDELRPADACEHLRAVAVRLEVLDELLERYIRLRSGGLASSRWDGPRLVVTVGAEHHERLRAQFAVVYPRLEVTFEGLDHR